jgi:hypothetical protein
VVDGTPGLRFGWELKAVQRDYNLERLETFEDIVVETTPEDVLRAYVAELDDSFETDNYNEYVGELLNEYSTSALMNDLLIEVEENEDNADALADELLAEALADVA